MRRAFQKITCLPAHARAAQIELCGFKSYKDKLLTAPFSPKINVVVGANGSGKSNFFHGKPGHGIACRELASACEQHTGACKQQTEKA